MSNEEIEQFRQYFIEKTKEIISSEKKAREFLDKTGIYDKNGNLSENYKS